MGSGSNLRTCRPLQQTQWPKACSNTNRLLRRLATVCTTWWLTPLVETEQRECKVDISICLLCEHFLPVLCRHSLLHVQDFFPSHRTIGKTWSKKTCTQRQQEGPKRGPSTTQSRPRTSIGSLGACEGCESSRYCVDAWKLTSHLHPVARGSGCSTPCSDDTRVGRHASYGSTGSLRLLPFWSL